MFSGDIVLTTGEVDRFSSYDGMVCCQSNQHCLEAILKGDLNGLFSAYYPGKVFMLVEGRAVYDHLPLIVWDLPEPLMFSDLLVHVD